MDSPALLRLSPEPITFEGLSLVNNVFYDDICKQVFAIRSGGAMGVVVKGPEEHLNHTFRMEDKGPILAVKFSLDQTILAVQRFPDSVEFTNFSNGELCGPGYTQTCRGRNIQIRGFIWTNSREILFITNNGVEFFSVNAERRSVRLIKSHALNVNWFLYNAVTSTLVICTGNFGNSLQPFLIRAGAIFKLARFELDIAPGSAKPVPLSDRDVVLAEIYHQNCLAVFKHQPRGSASLGGELVIFILNREAPPTKKHILKLDRCGKVAVHIVDNLVVIHHQGSRSSQIFDVSLPGETDGYVVYHDPVVCTRVAPTSVEPPDEPSDIYGQNSLIFQPDVIIDAKLGRMWTVECAVSSAVSLINDWPRLIDFLLSRHGAKDELLDVLRKLMTSECPLVDVGKSMDMMVDIYQSYWQSSTHPQVFGRPREPQIPITPWRIVINQRDMCMLVFTSVMVPMVPTTSTDLNQRPSRFCAILVEYARSLHQHLIPVEYFLLELLATTLIRERSFQLLHQLLQYGTIRDSKQMACLLLSLSKDYPPAEQIALDMLKRLNEANEQIIEILLNKGQLFTALRFLQRFGLLEPSNNRVDVRKFLDAALNSGDRMLFYSVFKFFEQRIHKVIGSPATQPIDPYLVYVQKYDELFGSPA